MMNTANMYKVSYYKNYSKQHTFLIYVITTFINEKKKNLFFVENTKYKRKKLLNVQGIQTSLHVHAKSMFT